MGDSHIGLEGVSRETRLKLKIYVEMLGKWNRSINLVSKSTLDDVWRRHIAEHLQIAEIGPNTGRWADLGSGAGLPGLIVAAAKVEKFPNTQVTMIESDQRKCAFIAAAANSMELDVSIECRRIEESTTQTYDVISARALAPLSHLLELSLPYRHKETVCIFPKGAKAEEEMTAAQHDWNVIYDTMQSVTDTSSTIFRIQEYSRVVQL